VARGPATTARVAFTTTASTVTMAVSCASGGPAAATTVTNAAAPASVPALPRRRLEMITAAVMATRGQAGAAAETANRAVRPS
jgi:hypothetical protein